MTPAQIEKDRAYMNAARSRQGSPDDLIAIAERLFAEIDRLESVVVGAQARIVQLTSERDTAQRAIDRADSRLRVALSWAGVYPAEAFRLEHSVDGILAALERRGG